jgi:tRNA G18 (ribose-2'-O)-methylase SpoU
VVHLIPIADPDDPRVAPYRDLRRPDAVARRDGFIAEGQLVLGRAAAGLYALRSVLLADGRAAALAPALDRLPPDVPVYVAAQPVLDAICGLPLHRGVLAHGGRPVLPDPETLLADAAAPLVCLVGVNDPDNMGAIFRNAAAFGAGGVLLDATCCDPLYRRAIRVSVGGALLVPHARLGPGEELIRRLHDHGWTPLALTPAGGERLATLAHPAKPALLFGAEGPGLPTAMLAAARRVSIPMAAGFDSLNVATACAIALHHLGASA